MRSQITPAEKRVADVEESGLRVLATFLDLALPLDERASIVHLTPAPKPEEVRS